MIVEQTTVWQRRRQRPGRARLKYSARFILYSFGFDHLVFSFRNLSLRVCIINATRFCVSRDRFSRRRIILSACCYCGGKKSNFSAAAHFRLIEKVDKHRLDAGAHNIHIHVLKHIHVIITYYAHTCCITLCRCTYVHHVKRVLTDNIEVCI